MAPFRFNMPCLKFSIPEGNISTQIGYREPRGNVQQTSNSRDFSGEEKRTPECVRFVLRGYVET